MESKSYPFSDRESIHPIGSLIISKRINEKRRLIEYDAERLLQVFQGNDPTEFADYSFLKDINKTQLNSILETVTNNIIEFKIEF